MLDLDAHHLALQRLPSIRVALRHDVPVAAELRDAAVAEMIASQFAEDRQAVPSITSAASAIAGVEIGNMIRKGQFRPELHPFSSSVGWPPEKESACRRSSLLDDLRHRGFLGASAETRLCCRLDVRGGVIWPSSLDLSRYPCLKGNG